MISLAYRYIPSFREERTVICLQVHPQFGEYYQQPTGTSPDWGEGGKMPSRSHTRVLLSLFHEHVLSTSSNGTGFNLVRAGTGNTKNYNSEMLHIVWGTINCTLHYTVLGSLRIPLALAKWR